MTFYQWLMSGQGLISAALFLFVLLILTTAAYLHSRRYVGFGWILGWYGKDRPMQGVFVLSRLLESPAHKAGVYKLDQLLEYDGTPMQFDSNEAFKSFWAARRKLLPGQRIKCKLRRNNLVFEVTLEAAVIKGAIPVHLPMSMPQQGDADYHDYHYGLAYCTRTGEYVQTKRLSDAALDRILG